jgi:signal transduction histidine kinase
MQSWLNRLFRNDILNQIDTDNLIERQKFKLFRVYVFITFAASVYTGIQANSSFVGGFKLAGILWALSLVFIACYSLVRRKEQLKYSYFISLITGCAVLHIQAYWTGGVLNTGTIYFCAAIMTSYMLLGPRYGHFFTLLGVMNIVVLYFATTGIHIADDVMFRGSINEKYDDALVTFFFGIFFIAGLSNNLHSNKNEVIFRITEQKDELELKNMQLGHYTKNLERKNSELDKFASIVSHDLKAPLRAIGNLTDWIEEDAGESLSGEVLTNFNHIKQRVKRMEDLINAILDYSRADRRVIQDEEVDVKQLVQESFDFIGSPKHVDLKINSILPELHADRTRLNQVFSNLFSNAVRYSDKSNVIIQVSAARHGDDWLFSVKDNGPGIDPKYHDKVFVIFQTLQRRDDYESTGVGLAIVKKIIEDQGGKVWVESMPGQGADFKFIWPSRRKSAENNLKLVA